MNYSIAQLIEILGAQEQGPGYRDTEIKQVLIDSRSNSDFGNSIFFAISGQRHDGHTFIPELYEKGLRCFVVEGAPVNTSNYSGAVFLKVKNSLTALQKLGAFHRKGFSIPVIGITGSNGKTIVKEWLFQLMREDRNIVRSPKSYNSQVGVPLSVLLLDSGNDLGIFEAGISLPAEMEKLEQVIQPTIGIITNIKEAHKENFKDHRNMSVEKLKLFRHSDTLIYCSDYAVISSEVVSSGCKKSIRWSLKDKSADYFIRQERKGNETFLEALDKKGNEWNICIPFVDEGSIENALHCWVLLLTLGYKNELIAKRMLNLSPVAMRLEMKEGVNNCLVINDSYNSDLGSLRISLDFLNQQKQHINKTIILSDILQSGKDEYSLYAEVAGLLEAKGIHRLIGIGPALERQASSFNVSKHFYSDTRDFLNHFNKLGFKEEAILIKGARSFGFEEITRQLQKKAHETVMEISLNALVHNLNYFRSRLKPGTKLMAMVKASSYGSGSFEIANILQYNRIDYLAVAFADEGVELRKAGITLPIMVMNPEEEGYAAMIEYKLEPELFSMRIIRLFSEAIKQNFVFGTGKSFPIHIKLDTGMKRLGFDEENLDELIPFLKENRNLEVRSVFSHLAAADSAAHDAFTLEQIARFEAMRKRILDSLNYPIISHILNSAGISRFPHAQIDMVRLGIGLYGIGWDPEEQGKLEYVNTLKTTVSQIKSVKAGESVGYNRSYFAKKDMRIATVPIGYADGLSRKLSNGRGRMILNGKEAAIVGTVCMDMCMIDITAIEAKENDEVIVFGKEYPIVRFAGDCETIPYEVLTSVSKRVKRVYFQE